MKFYLNSYALITKGKDDTLQFWGGSHEPPFALRLTEAQAETFAILMEGKGMEQERLLAAFPAQTVEHLLKTDILTETLPDTQSVHSRRNAFYRTYGLRGADKALEKKHVLILGCGGIGTHMAWHMAVMGIGKITLLDFDSIEPSNLNRQILFSLEDAGKVKTEVLCNRIRGINPDICVETINQKITSLSDLEQVCAETTPDLIIKALDSPAEFPLWLDQVCKTRKIPYIAGITMRESAMIGPTFLPGKSEVGWSDIVDLSAPPQKLWGTAPSLGAVLYHVSDALAVEAFKVLTGTGTPKYTGKIILRNLFDDREQEFLPSNAHQAKAAAAPSADSGKAAALGCFTAAALGFCSGGFPAVLLGLATVLILPHVTFSVQKDIAKYTLALSILFTLARTPRMVSNMMAALLTSGAAESISLLALFIGALSAIVLGVSMLNYALASLRLRRSASVS